MPLQSLVDEQLVCVELEQFLRATTKQGTNWHLGRGSKYSIRWRELYRDLTAVEVFVLWIWVALTCQSYQVQSVLPAGLGSICRRFVIAFP